MIRKVVAIKEYMPDGMTANIFCLKMESPAPMAALYKLLSHTLIYDSVRYRIRSKFLWYRYALLSADTTDFSLIDRILLSPAWLIYRVDCLRLTWIRKVGKSE